MPGFESDALASLLVFLERRGAAMARVIVMGNAEASVLSKYELMSMAEAPLARIDVSSLPSRRLSPPCAAARRRAPAAPPATLPPPQHSGKPP